MCSECPCKKAYELIGSIKFIIGLVESEIVCTDDGGNIIFVDIHRMYFTACEAYCERAMNELMNIFQ